METHNLVENGKMSDAKEKAVEAKKLADAAYDESAPKLWHKTRVVRPRWQFAPLKKPMPNNLRPMNFLRQRRAFVQGDKYFEAKDFLSSYHLFEESRKKQSVL